MQKCDDLCCVCLIHVEQNGFFLSTIPCNHCICVVCETSYRDHHEETRPHDCINCPVCRTPLESTVFYNEETRIWRHYAKKHDTEIVSHMQESATVIIQALISFVVSGSSMVVLQAILVMWFDVWAFVFTSWLLWSVGFVCFSLVWLLPFYEATVTFIELI